MGSIEDQAKSHLKKVMGSYFTISDTTWTDFTKILKAKSFLKGELLESAGDLSRCFYFVHEGLTRSYLLTEDGREINKIFFDRGGFPGNIVSLLKGDRNQFYIQALEDTLCLELDYLAYRKSIQSNMELAWFHISYIEKHWIVEKEPQDISLRSEEAYERYKKFTETYPQLVNRISLGHIASYLGITQTQLSRIRKKT